MVHDKSNSWVIAGYVEIAHGFFCPSFSLYLNRYFTVESLYSLGTAADQWKPKTPFLAATPHHTASNLAATLARKVDDGVGCCCD